MIILSYTLAARIRRLSSLRAWMVRVQDRMWEDTGESCLDLSGVLTPERD